MDAATSEQVEKSWRFCQDLLRSNPVIVVGSGASAPYGLPSMTELGEYIVSSVESAGVESKKGDLWAKFKSQLEEVGLENAIDQSGIWQDEELYSSIRHATWHCVCSRETIVQQLVVADRDHVAISDLFAHLLSSTNERVRVITTNYDRLLEFAAEARGYLWRTGFHPGYFGRWRGDEPALEFWTGQKKTQEDSVEIWKVHGSLDWFATSAGRPISILLSDAIPHDSSPLIVPPSIKKYADTASEPYRTVIQGADVALRTAAGFVCVGYGFNDDHIQVKLINRSTENRKPVLILARTLTPRTREIFVQEGARVNYLALEDAGNEGTAMYSPEFPDGLLIEGMSVWDLRHFVREVL